MLKHAESCTALTMLYTLAFKQNQLQNFILTKSSLDFDPNNMKNDKEDISVNLMSDHFVFAHGDNGGVIIKYKRNNDDESRTADGILNSLQRDELSHSEVRALCIVELLSALKKDSLAGDFFLYLVQELTTLIANFSGDMETQGKIFSQVCMVLMICNLCFRV